MKKLIFIIAAISFVNVSIAQEADSREKFQLGFKVGANLSNVYDSQGEEFEADALIGLAAGGFLKIPIGMYLGVQPEVLFSQKGYQGSGSVLGMKYEYSRRTNFIDVPLFLALKPTPNVTILAGPQYSYLMKQTDKFTSPIVDTETIQDFQNEKINKNIVSFVGGGDITIYNLVLGARAGWDITRNNGDGTSSTPRYKNAWYQATIGYAL